MRIISELSHDTFYKMEKYSQITIDYVEKVESIINAEICDDYTENDKKSDLIIISCDLSLILEIINPELIDDISMLEELQEILEDKLKDVKF